MFYTGWTCRVRNFCLEIDNKLFFVNSTDAIGSQKDNGYCSCILFVLAGVALMACEVTNPTGGQAFLSKI